MNRKQSLLLGLAAVVGVGLIVAGILNGMRSVAESQPTAATTIIPSSPPTPAELDTPAPSTSVPAVATTRPTRTAIPTPIGFVCVGDAPCVVPTAATTAESTIQKPTMIMPDVAVINPDGTISTPIIRTRGVLIGPTSHPMVSNEYYREIDNGCIARLLSTDPVTAMLSGYSFWSLGGRVTIDGHVLADWSTYPNQGYLVTADFVEIFGADGKKEVVFCKIK